MGFFNVFARIALDASQFEAGAKRVESVAAALGKKIAGYFTAGAIGYGLLDIGRSAIQAAGDIEDLAEQLEITGEEVQQLQKAARHAGVDMSKYLDVLTRIRKFKIDALAGDKTANKTLSTLGVSGNSNPIDIMKAIGGASTLEQQQAALDIVGTKSARIISSLREIHALTPIEIITPESRKALDDAADALGDMKASLVSVTATSLGWFKNFTDLWGGLLRETKKANMEKLGAGPGASTFRKIITSPLADIMSFIGWGGGVQVDQAFDKLMESQWKTDPIKKQLKEKKNEDLSKKIKDIREGYNDPLSFGRFSSSSANSRASIGGFFFGADQTARMDIERQQLAAQKLMADRIVAIEKQVAKIMEGS